MNIPTFKDIQQHNKDQAACVVFYRHPKTGTYRVCGEKAREVAEVARLNKHPVKMAPFGTHPDLLVMRLTTAQFERCKARLRSAGMKLSIMSRLPAGHWVVTEQDGTIVLGKTGPVLMNAGDELPAGEKAVAHLAAVLEICAKHRFKGNPDDKEVFTKARAFLTSLDTASTPKPRAARTTAARVVDYAREYPSEYTQGYQAYTKDGDKHAACPFTEGSDEREAFLTGWEDAYEDHD